MKNLRKATAILTLILWLNVICHVGIDTGCAENSDLSDVQQNALAMLNHITVLTQDINASKNSQIYMEEAYSELINNIYPNSVDNATLAQMTGLLDTMEKYRMVDVKRERLEFIYEQNQAQAMRAAIPSPVGMMSAVHSFTPARLAASVAYMAVDAYTRYTTGMSDADLQHIQNGWELDDEAAEALHNSRKDAFTYMIEMVQEYNIPGEFALTENAVTEFVKWKNDENLAGRIRFLKSNQETYQCYGGYWLLLAESCYNNGDYKACLDAIEQYEAMGIRIFRKDYDYARVLPLAIAAANEVCAEEEYVQKVSRFAEAIQENTENGNWDLRYFAAQAYVDLYGRTQNRQYIMEAYDIALDNVNELVAEQRTMNKAYTAAIQKAEAPEDASKKQKEQISEYNKTLADTRKTELTPASEALMLNCELLFELVDQMNMPQSTREEIDSILHVNGEPLFLNRILDNRYTFVKREETSENEIEVMFGGSRFVLPVEYVSKDTVVEASVKNSNGEERAMLTDWVLESVERGAEGDISSYGAVFVSAEAQNLAWTPEEKITVTIQTPVTEASLSFDFVAVGTKDEWYDYLKFWEGYKSHWYDYAKVWENSVVFEQVK